MERKLDVSSNALEKGVDLAKNFLEKLIIPPIEEVGLLIKDKVTLWRFNNQVRMLLKAQRLCEKHKIQPKAISLKHLCPLLDYAGLEENDVLQDKWANLLANMVDSEQNIENHVFPYLLSQVSVDEFMLLETVNKMRIERQSKLKAELDSFLLTKPNIEKDLKDQIAHLNSEMEAEKGKSGYPNTIWELQRKKWAIEKELLVLSGKERDIRVNLREPEYIPSGKLKEYEISNLIRLGLIKSIPRPYAYVADHKIKNDPNSEYLDLRDLEITIEGEDEDIILTELGELFIAACDEKK